MKRGLLLIGAGGHARSCIEVIESAGLPIYGLVDQAEAIGRTVLGYPVLGNDEDTPRLLVESTGALVTVGHITSASIRANLYDLLVRLKAERPVVVAPSAYVSRHARIGSGSILMHHSVVNAAASVGENVIINSKALVEHDAKIGDHCHISTGAIVNGGVVIGSGCFIGSNAVIRNNVSVGAGSIIGVGSVVLSDCPEKSVVKGKM